MTVIPKHLAHLERSGGLPVPLVVVPARRGHIELVKSTWPRFDLMTVWVPTGGPPDFGKYDEEKTRRCMAERWCHVCGCGGDLLVCSPTGPQHRMVGDRPMSLVSQPWVCAACLAYATRTCPPLSKAIEEGRGWVFAALPGDVVQVTWQPADPGDPIPPPGKSVLSTHKLVVPLMPAVQPLPDWSRRVAARYWRKWSNGKGLADV